MLNRRHFLKGTSLIALSPLVPGFVARTAHAAAAGKDRILVLLEMTGGNDGLNMVIPFRDDLYHKARPTLGLPRQRVLRINDDLGLNPVLSGLHRLFQEGQLAVIQGVGYPNADRSHFESMDVWQSADPKRRIGNGWLGRSLDMLQVAEGRIPGICVGREQLPLAMQGSATGVPALQPGRPYDLNLDTDAAPPGPQPPRVPPVPRAESAKLKPDAAAEAKRAERLRLIRDMADLSPAAGNELLSFVRRSSLQTYTSLDRLRDLLRGGGDTEADQPDGILPFADEATAGRLAADLMLVARLIRAGFGTRIFYVSIDGFDTHSRQRPEEDRLLGQVSAAIAGFFRRLTKSGDAGRVLLLTFSEFGRRVQENGSQGTDHGAASCQFLVGPGVKPGAHGKHPGLGRDELDNGDLRFHTDFRQVYATLLDRWLGCDSRLVLGSPFQQLALLK